MLPSSTSPGRYCYLPASDCSNNPRSMAERSVRTPAGDVRYLFLFYRFFGVFGSFFYVGCFTREKHEIMLNTFDRCMMNIEGIFSVLREFVKNVRILRCFFDWILSDVSIDPITDPRTRPSTISISRFLNMFRAFWVQNFVVIRWPSLMLCPNAGPWSCHFGCKLRSNLRLRTAFAMSAYLFLGHVGFFFRSIGATMLTHTWKMPGNLPALFLFGTKLFHFF